LSERRRLCSFEPMKTHHIPCRCSLACPAFRTPRPRCGTRLAVRALARPFALLALLLPGAFAAELADWRRPAEFEVTPVVVNANPGAWSGVMVEGPANSWIKGGAFEPMVLRRKWMAQGDAPNELILHRSDIDGWNSLRDGLYEGATVRVYRVVNGAFRKVRTDTIAHHYSSGWYPIGQTGDRKLLPPDQSTCEAHLDRWYRKNSDYYFKLVAVDAEGNESADSNIVSIRWQPAKGKAARADNPLVDFKAPEAPATTNAPASPRNLQGTFDPETALMHFTWEAVNDPDRVGYRLYYADRDPAQLTGFHLLLSRTPEDPDKHIRAGDMIFMEMELTEWDKRRYLSGRMDGTVQMGQPPALIPYHVDDTNTWALVPHPGPVPPELQALGGRTCLELNMRDDRPQLMRQFNHASPQQSYYRVLEPGKTYRAEVWLRQEGMTQPHVQFNFGDHYRGKLPTGEFDVTGQWQKFSTTFTPETMFANKTIGSMQLHFAGPGKLWVDNFRVYEDGADFMDLVPEAYDKLAASGLQFMRMQSSTVSGWGITMDMLTNPPGIVGPRAWHDPRTHHTYGNQLAILDKAGINPWLMLEIYLSEAELLGLVEFMAAPYDPAVDTPDSKPWAWKRHRQGRTAPWTDAFERILIELSNETWNPLFAPWTFLGDSSPDAATGEVYESGELYGLWQEYVIGILRSSPYWSEEIDRKFEFVLGGWAIHEERGGYGQQAAKCSPNSQHMTVAGYNGGWDEGEPPAEANDATRFKTLAFAVQAAEPRARKLAATQAQQKALGEADYQLGTYEAGPGYNLNGLNGVSMNSEQVEAESQVMKSLCGGTATIDSFLMRARYGYNLQGFYHFEDNRHYWTSHARPEHGGQVYPPWAALSMYNLYATGDHLLVLPRSTPVYDLPRTTRRQKTPAAPMSAVYATRLGNRYGVFCISRKMNDYPFVGDDGYTPMTIQLPFTLERNGKITLYKLEGDTRVHNLDTNHVDVTRVDVPAKHFDRHFVLNAARGADDRGLPPAATYLYVFEDTRTPEAGKDALVRIEREKPGPSPALILPVVFRIIFSQPIDPATLSIEDIEFGGSAVVESATIEPVPFSGQSVYRLVITDVSRPGTIQPHLAARKVRTREGGINRASVARGPVFEMGIPAEGGTYAFPVAADTRRASYSERNYGQEDRFRTFLPYTGNTGDRSFLRFPALPVLTNRPIEKAFISLYVFQRSQGPEGIPHRLVAMDDEWDENSLTNVPYKELHARTGDRTVSPIVPVRDTEQWVHFDCTGYVASELASNRVVSVVLDVDTSVTNYNSWAEFRSREYLDGLYAPHLTITFPPQP
jgi:hypothetical protein